MLKKLLSEKAFLGALLSSMIVMSLGELFFDDITNPWMLGLLFLWMFGVILGAAFTVVHHAEALAHKYGEPYGTLILTLAVIGVEVIMISSIMLHEENEPTFARDTIYSVLMIIFNGLVGITMLLGGLKFGEQQFNFKSANTYFSMILAHVGLGLFVTMHIPEQYTTHYDVFLIFASIVLYIIFLKIQTGEHRNFFTYEREEEAMKRSSALFSTSSSGPYHILLLIGTIGLISYLAESLAIVTDEGVDLLGVPQQLASLMVALLILAPECLTAIRAGLNNEKQRVINISLGSALATITLTIPAVLIIGFITNKDVILGLTPIQAMMVGFSLLIGMNTYQGGETNRLLGAVHIVLFTAYVVLIFL